MVEKHPKYVGDAKVRALLEEFSCPTPFHAIRARFMGNIASPLPSAPPIRAVEEFWPEGLPTFESEDEAGKLMHGLMSLWNHLSQYRNKPFKLTTQPAAKDRGAMRALMEVRTDEIDHFLEGLLGDAEELAVPEDIRAEIELLAENYALMDATLDVLNRDDTTDEDVFGLAPSLRELSKIATTQINDIIRLCVQQPNLH